MNKELKQIIETRKSIFPKDYSGESISEEILTEILNSAKFAPNHKRTKPWRFRLFRGEEKNLLGKKVADVYKQMTNPAQFLEKKHNDIPQKFAKSDAVVSIVVHFSGILPEWEEIAAVSMAVQNMYLTCTANQVGCYWGTPKMAEYLGDYLGLEENERCLGFFFMGKVSPIEA